MQITGNLITIKKNIPQDVTLVAVSKTKPNEAITEAYNAGHRVFGENKVQELAAKHTALPKDIKWHFIGHLQTNKVKYIAEFVSLIHAVDGLKLLQEVNKRAKQHHRIIDCLLQVKIAKEETKFGISLEEIIPFINSEEVKKMQNINLVGLMGMATNTDDTEQVKEEFRALYSLFKKLKNLDSKLQTLSMGMSGDYKLALEEGSNMVRVGSSIFGNRT